MDTGLDSTDHQMHPLKHTGEQQLPGVLPVCDSIIEGIERLRTQYPLQYAPEP